MLPQCGTVYCVLCVPSVLCTDINTFFFSIVIAVVRLELPWGAPAAGNGGTQSKGGSKTGAGRGGFRDGGAVSLVRAMAMSSGTMDLTKSPHISRTQEIAWMLLKRAVISAFGAPLGAAAAAEAAGMKGEVGPDGLPSFLRTLSETPAEISPASSALDLRTPSSSPDFLRGLGEMVIAMLARCSGQGRSAADDFAAAAAGSPAPAMPPSPGVLKRQTSGEPRSWMSGPMGPPVAAQSRAVSLRGGGGIVVPPPVGGRAKTEEGLSIAFWVYPFVDPTAKKTGSNMPVSLDDGADAGDSATEPDENVILFRGSDPNEPAPMLSLTNDGALIVTLSTEDGTERLVGPILRARCWTHVAAVVTIARPGAGVKLYVDGVVKAEAAYEAPAVVTWAPVFAGCGFARGTDAGVANALGVERADVADVALFNLHIAPVSASLADIRTLHSDTARRAARCAPQAPTFPIVRRQLLRLLLSATDASMGDGNATGVSVDDAEDLSGLAFLATGPVLRLLVSIIQSGDVEDALLSFRLLRRLIIRVAPSQAEIVDTDGGSASGGESKSSGAGGGKAGSKGGASGLISTYPFLNFLTDSIATWVMSTEGGGGGGGGADLDAVQSTHGAEHASLVAGESVLLLRHLAGVPLWADDVRRALIAGVHSLAGCQEVGERVPAAGAAALAVLGGYVDEIRRGISVRVVGEGQAASAAEEAAGDEKKKGGKAGAGTTDICDGGTGVVVHRDAASRFAIVVPTGQSEEIMNGVTIALSRLVVDTGRATAGLTNLLAGATLPTAALDALCMLVTPSGGAGGGASASSQGSQGSQGEEDVSMVRLRGLALKALSVPPLLGHPDVAASGLTRRVIEVACRYPYLPGVCGLDDTSGLEAAAGCLLSAAFDLQAVRAMNESSSAASSVVAHLDFGKAGGTAGAAGGKGTKAKTKKKKNGAVYTVTDLPPVQLKVDAGKMDAWSLEGGRQNSNMKVEQMGENEFKVTKPTENGGDYHSVYSNVPLSSGVYSWEILCTSVANCHMGIATAEAPDNKYPGSSGGKELATFWSSGGSGYWGDGTSNGLSGGFANGETIKFTFDADAGTLEVFKNDESKGVVEGIDTSLDYYPMFCLDYTHEIVTVTILESEVPAGEDDDEEAPLQLVPGRSDRPFPPRSGYYAWITGQLQPQPAYSVDGDIVCAAAARDLSQAGYYCAYLGMQELDEEAGMALTMALSNKTSAASTRAAGSGDGGEGGDGGDGEESKCLVDYFEVTMPLSLKLGEKDKVCVGFSSRAPNGDDGDE